MQGRFNFNGWILPAVRYREWRINRSWYILAAAMLVAPWFVQLYNDFKVGPAHILIIQLMGGYGNTTIAASTVIAGGLGLVVFWYDFSQGRLAYVLEGAVEHQDSMGNKEQVPAGEFQIMSDKRQTGKRK